MGFEANDDGRRDPGWYLPPPAPWELMVPESEPEPPPVEDADPEPISVFARERLMIACFAVGLLLFAAATDLATNNGRVTLIVLGGAAIGAGIWIWATPVLVVDAQGCTVSNYLPPKQWHPIDGFADLYIDGTRLTRRSDGRVLYTLRPSLVRPADVSELERAIALASTVVPAGRVYRGS